MRSGPAQAGGQGGGHLRQRYDDHCRSERGREEIVAKIRVLSTEITIQTRQEEDYISLTDIARYKDAERTDYIIANWLRNRNTIEFLGIWERLNNPGFNPIEFDGIRKQAGLNSFILTAKRWIEATGAIGLISRTGRYGGTYAHKDIAFEFASWVSVEFKLYLIKEFQRLKDVERKQLGWDIRAQSDQDQLPDSYRRHQRKPYPAGTHCATDKFDLCLGSGCPEHGLIRYDRQGVARQSSGR